VGEEKGLEVTILERREVSFPTAEGEPEVQVWITYRYGRLPPGLIRIPKKDLTPEVERARIKSDVEARLATAPERLRV